MPNSARTGALPRDLVAVAVITVGVFLLFLVRATLTVIQARHFLWLAQFGRAVFPAKHLHAVLDHLTHVSPWNQNGGAQVKTQGVEEVAIVPFVL